MNLIRKNDEDYTTFASIVNKNCDDFKLAELSPKNFKYLISCQRLVSNQVAEIRRRVLNKLENESSLALQQITEDCEEFVNVCQDSKNIKESGVSQIKKKYIYTLQETKKKERKKKNCEP